MATLRLNTRITVYDDSTASNNPSRRLPDWGRDVLGVPVDNPRAEEVNIDPLGEVAIFDGTRTLTHDGASEFALSLSPLDPSQYRLAWTGVGAAPGFRTDRALALSGGTVSLVLNANLTVTMTHSAGAVFGAVLVGDVVLIPGTSTGDTGPFDPLNEGYWTAIAASATTLVLARTAGTVFSGATEGPIAVTADSQVQAFSVAGVQVGDTVDLSAGFSAATLHSYKVVAVAASYIEFISTITLPPETAVSGIAGLQVYSASKRLVYLEANQEVAIKVNGDTSERTRLAPFLAADADKVGTYLKVGPTFSLTVKNRSLARVKVHFISVE